MPKNKCNVILRLFLILVHIETTNRVQDNFELCIIYKIILIKRRGYLLFKYLYCKISIDDYCVKFTIERVEKQGQIIWYT